MGHPNEKRLRETLTAWELRFHIWNYFISEILVSVVTFPKQSALEELDSWLNLSSLQLYFLSQNSSMKLVASMS
jgi:hypothetical protein